MYDCASTNFPDLSITYPSEPFSIQNYMYDYSEAQVGSTCKCLAHLQLQVRLIFMDILITPRFPSGFCTIRIYHKNATVCTR